ncbi:Hepatocyte growth factor-like protein [Seminavis robusta]|uniref:Hepatocyte growth factor-like protein n=1 Tax=Seminavis robusta TaxID=568900 RepID=A0A9N8EHL2_9STRA|nr:Hepatocyte growth factor-like protein [Seminavis robusta]|eukprot:Sro1111_g242430.1 Hepatocyte growth factor-like protein (694) ;mRNA; r:11064-13416
MVDEPKEAAVKKEDTDSGETVGGNDLEMSEGSPGATGNLDEKSDLGVTHGVKGEPGKESVLGPSVDELTQVDMAKEGSIVVGPTNDEKLAEGRQPSSLEPTTISESPTTDSDPEIHSLDESLAASVQPIPLQHRSFNETGPPPSEDDQGIVSNIAAGAPQQLIEAELVVTNGDVEEGVSNAKSDDGDVMVVAVEEDAAKPPPEKTPTTAHFLLVVAAITIVGLIVLVAMIAGNEGGKDDQDLVPSPNNLAGGGANTTNSNLSLTNVSGGNISASSGSTTPVHNEYQTCGSQNQRQADYRGTINVTVGGVPCQRWDVQIPHFHSKTPSNHPNSGLEENYCRNPDGESRTWCYTTDIGIRWSFCNVPYCSGPPGSLVQDLPNGSCIDQTIVLRDAILAYFNDSSQDSLVAQRLGWPIGNWCFSSELKSLESAFEPLLGMGDEGISTDISNWDVSSIWDFRNLFAGVHDISSYWGFQNWNTSSALKMVGVFQDTRWNHDAPPLDLSGWDVSKVINLQAMFQKSTVQQVNISTWNIQRVTSLQRFSDEASMFNEDISAWNTSSLENLQATFMKATLFNQDLSGWDTSKVTNMNNLFRDVPGYNFPMNAWDVSQVKQMRQIFTGASEFNQDISGWNVSKVVDLRWAFMGAISFNQNLCEWGALLMHNVKLDGIFLNTSCPNWTSPDLSRGGPFCHNCE